MMMMIMMMMARVSHGYHIWASLGSYSCDIHICMIYMYDIYVCVYVHDRSPMSMIIVYALTIFYGNSELYMDIYYMFIFFAPQKKDPDFRGLKRAV
jgi:hypothetical protein